MSDRAAGHLVLVLFLGSCGADAPVERAGFGTEGDAFVAVVGGLHARLGTQVQLGVAGISLVTSSREQVAPTLGDCVLDAEDASSCTRQVEYRAAGVTEWWRIAAGGLEQGWTVTQPSGLVIAVAVSGASVSGGRDQLLLRGPRGGGVRVGGLSAYDAAGRDLDARFEVTTDGFRVVVDAEGAKYPVTIDPVYSAFQWAVAGTEREYGFGGVVAGAGDLDADGYADVIVSDGGTSSTGYNEHDGVVYVFPGAADGLPLLPPVTLTSPGTQSWFGASAGSAGDVNGDGFDDLIVGACGTETEVGSAYVYLGSAGGVSATAEATLTGTAVGDTFGASVAAAGDVDGDGYGDVVVGASYANGGTGGASVFLGAMAGLSTTADTTLVGLTVEDRFGASVSSAGDVNADGYDDVVVGAEGVSRRRRGDGQHRRDRNL